MKSLIMKYKNEGTKIQLFEEKFYRSLKGDFILLLNGEKINDYYLEQSSFLQLPKEKDKSGTTTSPDNLNKKEIENQLIISKWDIKNVNSMKFMFYRCSSLQYIPHFFDLNFSKLKNYNCIFDDCLSYLGISKKNI